ncbi:MAG: hypothetical protein EVA71_05080 [Limisphaerales bacterium]|nr:MAG: hypothetical protein EVA71_05080 [Limisphaerales bacterium]
MNHRRSLYLLFAHRWYFGDSITAWLPSSVPQYEFVICSFELQGAFIIGIQLQDTHSFLIRFIKLLRLLKFIGKFEANLSHTFNGALSFGLNSSNWPHLVQVVDCFLIKQRSFQKFVTCFSFIARRLCLFKLDPQRYDRFFTYSFFSVG